MNIKFYQPSLELISIAASANQSYEGWQVASCSKSFIAMYIHIAE